MTTARLRRLSLCVVLLLIPNLLDEASAFVARPSVPSRSVSRNNLQPIAKPRSSRPPMRMAGFFDDVGKFFEELGGGNSNGNSSSRGQPAEEEAGESGDESGYIGSSRILTIQVESLKVGGLRLYLSLYLMGMQNTPDRGSWRAHQAGDSGIDVYYHDQTGALMIELDEEAMTITVDRLGSAPSNSYMMQEGVILDGLLDELDSIASDAEIDAADRLLRLRAPGDAIDNARATLAFS